MYPNDGRRLHIITRIVSDVAPVLALGIIVGIGASYLFHGLTGVDTPIKPQLRLTNDINQSVPNRVSNSAVLCELPNTNTIGVTRHAKFLLSSLVHDDFPWRIVSSYATAKHVICLNVTEVAIASTAINWSFDYASLQVCREVHQVPTLIWADLQVIVRPGFESFDVSTSGRADAVRKVFNPIHSSSLVCPPPKRTNALLNKHGLIVTE